MRSLISNFLTLYWKQNKWLCFACLCLTYSNTCICTSTNEFYSDWDRKSKIHIYIKQVAVEQNPMQKPIQLLNTSCYLKRIVFTFCRNQTKLHNENVQNLWTTNLKLVRKMLQMSELIRWILLMKKNSENTYYSLLKKYFINLIHSYSKLTLQIKLK